METSNLQNVEKLFGTSHKFNYGSEKIELKLVTKLADKKMWMTRFIRNYRGETAGLGDYLFGSNSIYLEAISNGKSLGFVRITDRKEFWAVSEAYVKPCYRGNGVLREMLKQTIKNYNVRMIVIELETLLSNSHYYSSLGFTKVSVREGEGLAYVLIEEKASKFFSHKTLVPMTKSSDFALAA